MLNDSSYAVTEAGSGIEGLRLTHELVPDSILLDLRLTDMTGIELCERLMTITPQVPCIFYTGDAYEIHRREALAAGAAAFVAKPDIEGLIDAVHQLLANSECAAA